MIFKKNKYTVTVFRVFITLFLGFCFLLCRDWISSFHTTPVNPYVASKDLDIWLTNSQLVNGVPITIPLLNTGCDSLDFRVFPEFNTNYSPALGEYKSDDVLITVFADSSSLKLGRYTVASFAIRGTDFKSDIHFTISDPPYQAILFIVIGLLFSASVQLYRNDIVPLLTHLCNSLTNRNKLREIRLSLNEKCLQLGITAEIIGKLDEYQNQDTNVFTSVDLAEKDETRGEYLVNICNSITNILIRLQLATTLLNKVEKYFIDINNRRSEIINERSIDRIFHIFCRKQHTAEAPNADNNKALLLAKSLLEGAKNDIAMAVELSSLTAWKTETNIEKAIISLNELLINNGIDSQISNATNTPTALIRGVKTNKLELKRERKNNQKKAMTQRNSTDNQLKYYYKDILRRNENLLLAVSILVALSLGLALLYINKPFGSEFDYLFCVLWGSGIHTGLKGFNEVIKQLGFRATPTGDV